MKKKLHPRVKISWRISSYLGIIFIAIFTYWMIFPYSSGMSVLIILMLIMLLIIFSEVWIRLSYNRWFYEFTPSNLKVERGVVLKKYSTIPYQRIQNIDIRRGLIARIFGFSTIMIQTAGYSYIPGTGLFGFVSLSYVEGYIPAVSVKEGEKIRDFLLKKISKNSSQGI